MCVCPESPVREKQVQTMSLKKPIRLNSVRLNSHCFSSLEAAALNCTIPGNAFHIQIHTSLTSLLHSLHNFHVILTQLSPTLQFYTISSFNFCKRIILIQFIGLGKDATYSCLLYITSTYACLLYNLVPFKMLLSRHTHHIHAAHPGKK